MSEARGGFRADIQGLRAIAVVLVILNHAFLWPGGGFVGVDVFYVISGYLITGLLLRELDTTGSISLRAFYARRVRRIVPVATLVLAVTVAAAFAIWFQPRAWQTLLDAISALFFVSNWHLIATGADYLRATGPVSPVQHYWSLSIEEQFYAAWPLLLLGLFWFLRRNRALIITAIIACIAVSVAWSAYQTIQNPAAAYFNTLARVWELLIGALLAAASGCQTLGHARRLIAWTGIVLIIGGSIVVQADWAVPFPWVAPAVVGTALVIWADAPASRSSLLGNPVSQWLGDNSYSLYLWHFPVLVFATALFRYDWWVALACIPVMLALSALSRRWVEQGVLASGFLRTSAKAKNVRPFVPKDVLLGVSALITIAVLSLGQLRGPVALTSANDLANRFDVPHANATTFVASEDDRTLLIREALQATAWPADITADLDVLYRSQLADTMRYEPPGCLNYVDKETPTLICNDIPDPDIIVLGDSYAASWAPAVEKATEGMDVSVSVVGFAGCSLIDAHVRSIADSSVFRDRCAERREEMFRLIEARQPRVVVLSAYERMLEYTGLPMEEAAVAWEEGLERTFNRIGDVAHVVLLASPPRTTDPLECATRVNSPQNCAGIISEQWQAKTAAEVRAAASRPNVTYVDTADWFCSDGQCPAFIGGDIVRLDDPGHLTDAASTAVGPLLKPYLP